MDTPLASAPPAISPRGLPFLPNNARKRIFALAVILLVLLALGASVLKKEFRPFAPSPEKFSLVESSPSDFDNVFSPIGQPTFVFSKKLSVEEKDLSKYFAITPTPSGTWYLEKNGQVVYFASDEKREDSFPQILAYDTVYTVTIAKELRAQDGETLPEEAKVTFRTTKKPDFGLDADYKLINTFPNQKVKATFYRPPNPFTNLTLPPPPTPLTVTIKTASEEQLFTYFQYKKGKRPLYIVKEDPSSKEVATFQTTPSPTDSTYGSSYTIDIPEFSEPGMYFVTVRNELGSEDFFIVVANHINQVFTDTATMHVWVTETNTAKSLSNVQVDLVTVSDTVSHLESGKTEVDGLFKAKAESGMVDFVVTRRNTDVAVTQTQRFEKTVAKALQAFSYTDRPVYRPGDTVHFKAVVRKRENGSYSIPNGILYARLITDYIRNDPSGYQEVALDANGTITYDVKLPENVTSSYPQITLSVKGEEEDQYEEIGAIGLNVQSYRKPDMDIKAEALEIEYVSRDTAHVTVFGRTLYGKPLSGVSFSYRVLTNPTTEIKDRSLERIEEYVGYYGYGEELAIGQGIFDAKGKASIEFSTDLARFEPSQIATLEVTPQIGASPSIGKIAKLIHRGEFALFFENVEASTETGVKGNVTALNHNRPRSPLSDQNLTLSLYEEPSYQAKNLLQTTTLTTNGEGISEFSFPTTKEGSYELVVQGNDPRGNTVTVRYPLYVGIRQTYTPPTLAYTLAVKTQKDKYKGGETATMSISADFPIADAIVATTTHSGSYSYYNRSTIVSLTPHAINSNTFTLPIAVPVNQVQPIGIDVATVQNGTVVASHADIFIDTKEKELFTTITFDKKRVKPGDTISATITTKDALGQPVSADTSLSVIDASILQIGKFTGDIFDSFYGSPITASVTRYNSTTGIYKERGGGGGGCFLAGTQIRMSDGSLKNIEDVQVGDRVLTRSSDTANELVPDTVTQTFRHVVSNYLTINKKLRVTPIHRIFVNNAWRQAKDIHVGDMLLFENGDFIKVTSVEQHTGQFLVFNLTTEKMHTFFADGFYVHNEKGNGVRQNFVDTVYWNPHIRTDENGVATVSIKVPDNLTTFAAYAIANTQNSQFGQSTGEFITEKAVAIIPAIPNFYYEGDTPVIGAIIQNSLPRDVEITFRLSIKELGLEQNQTVTVKTSDLEQVAFPVDVGAGKDTLSFLFEAQEKATGNVLDSVLLKKPVLPRGNIEASWTSFEGSGEVTFTPPYPDIDFNQVAISLTRHVAYDLMQNTLRFDTYSPSARLGEQLYVGANIIVLARDGTIPPHMFNYAALKHNFREAITMLLAKKESSKDGVVWRPQSDYNDSFMLTTLWVVQGLREAANLGLLADLTNTSSLINDAVRYVSQYENLFTIPIPLGQPFENQPVLENNAVSYNEKLLMAWVLGKSAPSEHQDEPEFLAVQALSGSRQALARLRGKTLPSASDRYIFGGSSDYSATLSTLAMVEKGTGKDSEKAVRGLSAGSSGGYSTQPLGLLAAVRDAIRNKRSFDTLDLKVFINDSPFYSYDAKRQKKTDYPQYFAGVTQTFSSANAKDGKINIRIEVESGLPIYTTITQTTFQKEREGGDSSSEKVTKTTAAQVLEGKLERSYKDIQTGEAMDTIRAGQPTAIVLRTDNPIYIRKNLRQYSPYHPISLTEAIAPNAMFLDQTSGNSPQYQSVLDGIFGSSQYSRTYLMPFESSDEAAFFNGGIPAYDKILFAYVVYAIADGSHYQPKTSLVFPSLGLILKEK